MRRGSASSSGATVILTANRVCCKSTSINIKQKTLSKKALEQTGRQ
jgi:hypothetical protein